MNIQNRRKSRKAVVVMVLLANTAAVLTSCSGAGDKKADAQSSSRSSASKGSGSVPGASVTTGQNHILAQVKGEKNILVTINTAIRDSGGFVTVEGRIVNGGEQEFDAVSWVGQEVAVSKSGASVAGAVLVDQTGKKRYYVLRDTDGKCLCTMKLLSIKPKESRPFFAQFPAPPPGTTEVEFQLPTMPPAKIQISEG